jgi:hypothetical protein
VSPGCAGEARPPATAEPSATSVSINIVQIVIAERLSKE